MNSHQHNKASFLEKLFPPSPYNKSNLPERYCNISSSPAYNYVIWESKARLEQKAYQDKAKQILLESLKKHNETGISLWLRDNKIKSITLRDDKTSDLRILALIRIREQSESSAKDTFQFLGKHFPEVAAYEVENSVPLDYAQTWSTGTQSPGLVSLSFFTARKGLSRADFREYWFCSHTPFALDIHPLWKYERNAVLSALEEGMPEFQAIVPLHVQNDKDLRFKPFFSHNNKNPLFNALRINNDVKNFIDLKNIQTVAMREYLIS